VKRAALLLAGALSACVGAPSVKKDATDPIVAIRDVAVIPMDTERVLEHQTVIVRDGKIAALGSASDTKIPDGAQIVDGKGRFLLPGLADMHTHLGRPADLLVYLARGVTLVRNMWGAPIHLQWRELIARGQIRGPEIVTAGPIVDGANPVHDGSFVATDEAGAARVVPLHTRLGYDFVKVYGTLPKIAYDKIVADAHAAHLPVAGHIPREVGLAGTADAGQHSFEHMDGILDAVQRDDSPVRGKFDNPSRRKKLDYIDESKLAPLIKKMAERDLWACPTRVVRDSFADPEEVRRRIQAPETQYVPSADRATWDPGPTPPEVITAFSRYNAFIDRVLPMLRDGGVRIIVGTDTGNPLVVPGFSVHRELAHLVRVGLTPYQALRAATHDPAEYLGRSDFGTIAAGQRANLLLLDGNPLIKIANTEMVAGVVARGHFYDPAALDAMLAEAKAAFSDDADPFAKQPALGGEGRHEQEATYRIHWKGAAFGSERLWIGHDNSGQPVVHAQTYDPHEGQAVTFHAVGRTLQIESDGAAGRGHLDFTRGDDSAKLTGQALSGDPVEKQVPFPADAEVGVQQFLASTVMLLPRFARLGPGDAIDLTNVVLGLGSTAEARPAQVHVTRLPDENGARRFTLSVEKRPPSTLTLDGDGLPRSFEIDAFGSTVRFDRVR
jgi:hypothetical protein